MDEGKKHVICPHCGAENRKSLLVTTCRRCLQPLAEREHWAGTKSAPAHGFRDIPEPDLPRMPAAPEPPSRAPERHWSRVLRLAALGTALGSLVGLIVRGPVLEGEMRPLIGAAVGAALLAQLVQDCPLVHRIVAAAAAWAVALGTWLVASDAWRIAGRPAISSWWLRRVTSRSPLVATVSMRDAFVCGCMLLVGLVLAVLASRIVAAISRWWAAPARTRWRGTAVVVAALAGLCVVRGAVGFLFADRHAGPMDAEWVAMGVVWVLWMVGVASVVALLVRRRARRRVEECERLAPAVGGRVKEGVWGKDAEIAIPTENCTVTFVL